MDSYNHRFLTMSWTPPSWATDPLTSSRAMLEVRQSGHLLKTHALAKKKAYTLGRQAGTVDIHIADEAVSRLHAALVHRGETLYLIDLNSAAGVMVAGRRVKPNDAVPLAEGMHFVLGDASSVFQYVVTGLSPKEPAPPPAPPAAAPSWQPPSWAVAPTAKVSMHLEEGGKLVQVLDLSRHSSYVLGRSAATAKIVVPHASVSRQHAAIVHGRGGAPAGAPSLHVIDLGSAMGTFVDLGSGWSRIPPEQPTQLPPGSRVRLGDCPARLVYALSEPSVSQHTDPPATTMAPPLAAPVTEATGAAQALHTLPAGPAIGPAPPPDAASTLAAEEDAAPQFSSLLSSTLISAASRPAPSNSSLPLQGGGGSPPTGASTDGEQGASSKPLKNDDFRSAFLPFLTSKPTAEKQGGGPKRKGKPDVKGAKRRRNAGDDSDDDDDQAPAVVLDKSAAASSDAGLVLRKAKTGTAGKKAGKLDKIKF